MGYTSIFWICAEKKFGMSFNDVLSITVPTYNRAEFLNEFLELNIPIARSDNIQIFISDNASTDNTKNIVYKWMKDYEHLHYSRNQENLGMDKNFELALKLSNTEYTWLFGDTYTLPIDGFKSILTQIKYSKNEYDAIIINLENRVFDIFEQDYKNCNKFLRDLGWHTTCLACNIFKTNLISKANFSRYYNTELVHVGILFEYIASKEFLIKWLPNINVTVMQNKINVKNGWSSATFEIWIKKWPNLIYSLPSAYDIDSKNKCIFDHNYKAKLLSLVGLLNLRARGILNFQAYLTYKKYFSLSTNITGTVILLISIIPHAPLRILREKYLKIRNLTNIH